MKEDKYKVKTDCSNCHCNNQDTELERGTTVSKGLEKAKCKNCGCMTLKEKTGSCSCCPTIIYRDRWHEMPRPNWLVDPYWQPGYQITCGTSGTGNTIGGLQSLGTKSINMLTSNMTN